MRHIAVIGSGPAGYYSAEALQKQFGDDVRIDMIDRMPVPYGLIRFGVAPDHQSIKAVAKRYEKVALSDNVRFVGNVSVGRDVSIEELRTLYDAVVLGSQSVRRQGADRRRALVMITDAGETTSVSKFEDARRAAIAANILLYTVVVRPMKSDAGWNTTGEHALSTITDSVGGAMYYPTDLSELGAIFDRINRELRTQYLLGYYPTPTPPPGSDRHVAVSVNTGDTVRYRKEYFTAGVAQ